ncbi:DMT family transporter [Marinivivus vitaminiproducens]|uniref:DMT family transporter n=1 Tax=Marinivivus vitaminiproducens TaxID=3035935 RepID=UPI0027A8A1A1|nr:DMT family transporter [Geminicoccaceae bacterium SCSIO 64248]
MVNVAPHRAALLLLSLEAGLIVSWSGGFVGYRFAADHAPVFQISFWRFLIAALILAPFAWPSARLLSGRALARHALIGILAVAGYLGGLAKAIAFDVPSGLAALMADLVPVAVLLLSMVHRGERPTRTHWLGTGLACAGMIAATAGALRLGDAPGWAYGLPLLSVLALALATLMQKDGAKPDVPLATVLFLHMASATPAFAVLGWLEGGLAPTVTAGYAASLAWLVVVPTFGGYGLYWLCLNLTSPARVTSVLYLSPPVTMLWTWLMFDEPLSAGMAAGLGLTLAGLILIARSPFAARPQLCCPMPSAASVRPIQACTEG